MTLRLAVERHGQDTETRDRDHPSRRVSDFRRRRPGRGIMIRVIVGSVLYDYRDSS